MIKELLPRRVPRDHIAVTGIPVRVGFDEEHDTVAIRERFSLPQDKMIVLVMAGAKYSEPYFPFRRIVEPMFGELSNFLDMHFVFLAGEDYTYAEHLKQVFKERGSRMFRCSIMWRTWLICVCERFDCCQIRGS